MTEIFKNTSGKVINFLIHFQYYNLLFILILLAFLFYLFPILFPKTSEKFRLDEYAGVPFQSELYKVPIRWFGGIYLFFYSFISKNGKVYYKELKTKYNEEIFGEEFLISIGKEWSYSYALFIANTVHFHQRIKYYKSLSGESLYSGFLGFLKLYTDSYRMRPNSERFKFFEQKRYNLDSWIPLVSENYFNKNELDRTERYYEAQQNIEAERLSYKINEGFEDLQVNTRDVDISSKKRFD
jgi:hypothetical protein